MVTGSDGPAPGHVIDIADTLGAHVGGRWTPAERYRGQTVTIRHDISYAASARIQQAAVKLRARPRNRAERRSGGGTGGVDLIPDPRAYLAAVVGECVLEWTLTGIDGAPLPCRTDVDPETCPRRMGDILDAIVDHYRDPGEDDDDEDPTGRS